MTDPMSSSWSASAAPEGAPQPTSPVPSTAPVSKPKKSGNVTNVLLGLAAVVAVGGLAFAAGRATAPAAASSGFTRGALAGQNGYRPSGSFDPGSGPGGFGGFGDRALTLTGTVASVDGSSMTLTTQGGQTVTIDVSGATYHAQTAATASDVTTGSTVEVSVKGFGGARPNASAAPDASRAPGTGTITATDVTVVPK